jgi:BirA family transcriptional regulator, biotin operon repressor / biotin---[acetyl-CoA-carboxylase] ligase
VSSLGAGIPPLLHTRALGRELHAHDVIGSTNDEALRLARAGAPHGTLVLAEAQTAGRGRRGRSWLSPAAGNLYLSLVLRPNLPPQRAPELVPVVAVAAAEALRELGVDAAIKWPNDLLIEGRKVAGILTELSAGSERILFAVVGVGLNANGTSADLPEEIRPIATSVREALGREVSRADLVAAFLGRLEHWLDCHEAAGFAPVRERYRALSATLGRRVRLIDAEGEVEGIAEDVDEAGALLLRRDDGTLERARTGDVTSLRGL